MAEDKVVSKDGYLWGHIGTIIFHIAIAVVLITIYFMSSWSRSTIEKLCLVLGSVLLAVSLLSLVPILKYSRGLKNVTINRE